MPAAALGALGAFGAALAQAGAQRGMPSGQVMTLALLKRAGGPVNVAPLAAALDLSLPAVRLQIEGLVEKGLAKPGSSPNEVLLEPSGAQRLEAVLAHEAVGRVRAASAASWRAMRLAPRPRRADEPAGLCARRPGGRSPSVAATPLGATASNRPRRWRRSARFWPACSPIRAASSRGSYLHRAAAAGTRAAGSGRARDCR
ncbi:MAG: hypothetical protein ACLSDQ_01960 [Adlercreutzia equolifaciens]